MQGAPNEVLPSLSLLGNPGVVTMKQYSDSNSTCFQILPSPDILPSVISPSGLSSARQWYLYNQIREFCRDGTQVLVCPHPLSETTNNVCLSSTTDAGGLPPITDGRQITDDHECEATGDEQSKRSRRCGNCGNVGHDRRTCNSHK